MRSFLAALLCLASPAIATEHNTPARIDVACNAHGAKVTFTDGLVVYLGKSCDAAIPGQGEGKWWYAASAFLFEVGNVSLRVPAELNCPVLPYCTYQ